MKLSEFAKAKGVHYRTAWRWFKAGLLDAEQMPTGTIIVRSHVPGATKPLRTAVYARISASEKPGELESQANRVIQYCDAKGYRVAGVVKEIGSGINDRRPKLLELLSDPTVTRIVVEHKDRLTQIGFNYIESMLKAQGRQVEVVTEEATL